MSHFDVFNGDADGICALHQLRLAAPRAATLVTGVKRDIGLLARVPARSGDTVTVLDVSLDRNRAPLLALLARGVAVEYFDHHFAGEVPAHPALRAELSGDPHTCTSLLVDRHLGGRHRRWALVGAFGDNLAEVAAPLGAALGLADDALEALRALGEAMNHNAYGDSVAELLVPPDRLYQAVRPYADPLAFIAGEALAGELVARQRQDLACAEARDARTEVAGGSIHLLPDAPWARRVLGAYANVLSRREPARAHAVLRATAGGDYVVSVRAPRTDPRGADALCRRFGGSGRAASAGIDRLPQAELDGFAAAFAAAFGD